MRLTSAIRLVMHGAILRIEPAASQPTRVRRGRNHEGHEVHEAKIVTFVICAVRLPVHGGL